MRPSNAALTEVSAACYCGSYCDGAELVCASAERTENEFDEVGAKAGDCVVVFSMAAYAAREQQQQQQQQPGRQE